MTVEKFTSDKATVECRHNPVTQRFRCHISIGEERIGPLYAVGDGTEPDAAARYVLARAVEQGRVNVDDIETDDEGAPVVHAEDAKGKAAKGKAADAKAPAAKGKAKAPASTEKPARGGAKSKRAAAPMGEEKADDLVGNGEETRALEDAYLEAKDQYHEVGDALKERHLAVAALAEQPS